MKMVRRFFYEIRWSRAVGLVLQNSRLHAVKTAVEFDCRNKNSIRMR